MLDQDLEKHFGTAMQALQQKDWSGAQRLFQDITHSWPDCKEAWYHRGELYQRQGDWTQAIEMYTRVLEIDPGIQEVYFHLGLMAAQQQETAIASAYWHEALALNPGFYEARLQLALLLARSGEVPAAIAQLRQMLQLDPETAALLLDQAQTALLQGQLLEASAFCQALRLGSVYESTRVLLIEIQVLHELGLDAEARVLLQELANPWGELLRQLYVPAVYPDQTSLEQSRQQLDQALGKPPADIMPALSEFPRLRGWALLGRTTQVDAWLEQATILPASEFPAACPPTQKLVWIVDAGSLPWQKACWKHLAALPGRKWEIHLLLRHESLQLLLELPPLRHLTGIGVLPASLPEALALLQRLQPQVLLLSNPASDGLQFWLSRLHIAPVQLAWPGTWPLTTPAAGQAALWLPLFPAKASGETVLFPLPAQGWEPQDLSGLRKLADQVPLQLIAPATGLGAVLSLQRLLGDKPIPVQVWHNLDELSLLMQQAAALLVPAQGAGPYLEAAASCALPCLEVAAEETTEALRHLSPNTRAQTDWLARDRQNPPTEWAVMLQDSLVRSLTGVKDE